MALLALVFLLYVASILFGFISFKRYSFNGLLLIVNVYFLLHKVDEWSAFEISSIGQTKQAYW